MKVILLKGVSKLGNKDQIVEVPDGYAQNALFPKKLAIPATRQAVVALEKKLAGRKAVELLQGELLEKAMNDLESKNLTMKVRTNKQGHLFAKIDKEDIAKFLEDEERISVDPKNIFLKDPIKQIGTFSVPIVTLSFKGSIKINIESI